LVTWVIQAVAERNKGVIITFLTSIMNQGSRLTFHVAQRFFSAVVLTTGIFLDSRSKMSESGIVGQAWEYLALNNVQHCNACLWSNFNVV
jgi:hypothetical protein